MSTPSLSDQIRFIKKSDSPLMRFFGFLLAYFTPDFMRTMWVTLPLPFGKARIYVPSMYDKDSDWGSAAWKDRHLRILEHELVHIAQARRYSVLGMLVMYVGPAPFFGLISVFLAIFGSNLAIFGLILTIFSLPLTVGLAYGRYVLEREAYMIMLTNAANEQSYEATATYVARTLWVNYLFTWPKGWSKSWIMRQPRL